MKIHGIYTNRKGKEVEVDISSPIGDEVVEIGERRADGNELWFASDDTITTESGFNDCFDVVIGHSASINLQTISYVPALFGKSYKDVHVEIIEGGKCVFRGFIDPNTYNQPFVDVYDDLELSCIDVLSSLQYSYFRNVVSKDTYDSAVASAGTTTFWELIKEALTAATGTLDGYSILYDGSRKASVKGATAENVFNDYEVSDLVFLGDDEDDVNNYADILENILKYLNLHIVQYGTTFYIFSWETLRKGSANWVTLYGTDTFKSSEMGQLTVLSQSNVEDDDAQIEVTEAFNKISLTVSRKTVEDLTESPLDDLDSLYPHRQLYCTEYRAHYADEFTAFFPKGTLPSVLLSNGTIKDAYWCDWYLLAKSSRNWIIGRNGNSVEAYAKNNLDFANNLVLSPGAALLSLGCVKYNDTDEDKNDNSPKTSLTMDDYLVIGVNVTDDSKFREESGTPIAVYTGSNGGAVLSPPDNDTVNYIVISGTIRLEGKTMQSGTIGSFADAPLGLLRSVRKVHETTDQTYVANYGGNDIPVALSRVKSNGHADCYLVYRWYKETEGHHFGNLADEDLNPLDQAHCSTMIQYYPQGAGDFSNGLRPPSEFDNPDLEYQYSEIGNKGDRIHKVSVLECMLVVGNKVLVEDMESGNGAMSSLTWKAYKTMEECTAAHPGDTEAAEDEYYSQTFSIGFDPKIGDHLLNEDHDIQTNFDYTLGIDTEKGMAIPVQHSDHLQGKVSFQILGVVNSYYFNKITRRHRTWFRKEKWNSEQTSLMQQVRAVFIKDFSIKLYSDNTMTDNDGDNDGDIIYTSDTDESFYNKKDDLEFKIHSAFTTKECTEQGLAPVTALTTVVESSTQDGCLSIVDTVTGETLKAEAEYVSEYYDELHVPRIVMTVTLQKSEAVTPWRHYRSEAMGKEFYVQSTAENLMDGSVELTLKEVF